jgi:hypothetical protein
MSFTSKREDPHEGTIVCIECGLVSESDIMLYDEYNDSKHCEIYEKPYERSLSASKYEIINTISSRLGDLPQIILDDAFILAKRINKRKHSSGKVNVSFMVLCVYYACLKHKGCRREMRDIVALINIPLDKVIKVQKEFIKILEKDEEYKIMSKTNGIVHEQYTANTYPTIKFVEPSSAPECVEPSSAPEFVEPSSAPEFVEPSLAPEFVEPSSVSLINLNVYLNHIEFDSRRVKMQFIKHYRIVKDFFDKNTQHFEGKSPITVTSALFFFVFIKYKIVTRFPIKMSKPYVCDLFRISLPSLNKNLKVIQTVFNIT